MTARGDATAVSLGIDIGGTNTKFAVLDGRNVVLRRRSRRTDRSGPTQTVATALQQGKELASSFPGLGAMCLALPGHADAESGRTFAMPNLPGDWAGFDVAAVTRRVWGDVVPIINDARAAGLAEARLGAARTASIALNIVIGTGVGGSLTIGGRLHLGATGEAGEIGHTVVQADGPRCGCGNRGCLEAFVNSRAIAQAAECTTVEEAAKKAMTGDRVALRAFDDAASWLGIAVANALMLVAPDLVTIGGGVAQAGDVLLDPLRRVVGAQTPLVRNDSYAIVRSRLGSYAGAFGAALYAGEASASEAANEPLSMTHRSAT